MEGLPTPRRNVNFSLGDSLWPGFMKGDHTYFRNESRETWENDLLRRAVITEMLSEHNSDQPVGYIRCFKLCYTYSLGMFRGKAKFFSFNLPFWSTADLGLKHVKPYYDWYVDMPMEQQLPLGENCSVKMEKCGDRRSQIYKGKVHETVSYGFRFMLDKEGKEKLMSVARSFAIQLLQGHEELLLRYVDQIKAYIDEAAQRYSGFTEFDYVFSPLEILIDATGVYVKYDETCPNGCQFQQLGLPLLSIVQQYGMGLAIRSLLEKVTKEKPIRMKDGTRIFYSMIRLNYDVLDYDPDGCEKQYIGWIGHVKGLPIQNARQTAW